jgi:xanthine dehydrogenase YagR molybdenum-binding subunit
MQTWGANFVEIGIDRDLGLIRLRRVVARYSAGRIINPLTARSQMIGGIIWEWGKATMEASVVEPRYGRFLAKNLSNVALPVNADIPADAIDVGFIEEVDPPCQRDRGQRHWPWAARSSPLPAPRRPPRALFYE